MSNDERRIPGTGGLTFEPPAPESSEPHAIGFAKELLDDVEPHPAFAEQTAEPPPATPTPATPPSATSPATTAAGSSLGYPRASAALGRLLASMTPRTAPAPIAAVSKASLSPLPPERRPSQQNDMESFSVGPAVMRAPPAVKAPPPERPTPADAEAARAVTKGRLEDMVDLMFMGSGGDEDDPSNQQIHLQFKEEVLDGLYVTLVKVDGGMRATFVVRDANSRRLIDGHVQNLVARLSSKGIQIVDTVIETQQAEKAPPARHGFDKEDHFDDL